jgi:RNA polymerase-associated protein RTF1
MDRRSTFLLDLGAELSKPYKVNNQLVNQTLELKHGMAVKAFQMDKVSNVGFQAVSVLIWSWACDRFSERCPERV